MVNREILFRQVGFKWLVIIGLLLGSASYSQAQERLCDTAFEDCRQPLWNLIDAETVGIDVAFWFMQDTSLSNKIIARHNAGVPVRVLVDPRANPTYTGNGAILDQLAAAGIPMRYKLNEGILHWKMMLFVGQNKVQFSGANYSPHFFVPTQPFQNYIDEAIYFTDDPAIVNSFKTKYDSHWTDTVRYGNYANIFGPLTRRYATYQIDPSMNFPFSADGSEDFYNRTYYHINNEPTKIDVIMYRITNDRYTGALIDAIARGVPVRLIHEQDEYRNRARQWDAYNVDRLYMAGVQIKWRNAQRLGLNHEKTVLLYGQGVTIFGSSNWTGPSSNYQDEHNYFTTKSWFFQWFVNHFERKWNTPSEFVNFTPLPPDAPLSPSPSSGAINQPLATTLRWEGGPWSHKYDIYFGTNANPPLLASNVFLGAVDDGVIETYSQLPPLQDGTKYYWRIVGKTMANQTASSPVWNFTTAGNAPPPGTPPGVTSVSPSAGTTSGGTSVTITGTNFAAGATVKFGGAAATAVNVLSGTSINATTPAHSAGAVDVVVTNSNNLSGTLANGYTYNAPSTAVTITSIAPNSGTTSGGTGVTIAGSNFAAGATVSFGGVPATNVNVVSPTSITATTPAHEFGAVNVVVTNPNNQTATLNGGFTYAEALTAGEIVLYASEAVKVGNYSVVLDATAAGGARIYNPDAGMPKLSAALANPTTYFEMTFNAQAGIPYRLWMRGKANVDSPYDDSVFIQFSDSVDSTGAAIDRIGTTSADVYNLEECSGCGLSGWGWQDDGWGVGVLGPLFYFPTTGSHTIRIQVREDGLSIDQIVLSAQAYLNSSPGALKNDTTILPKTGAPPSSAPTLSGISPTSGTTLGGTSVSLTGTGFVSGATVSFGGASATSVSVVNGTSITASTPAHAAGVVNVVVTNPDNQSATLTNGYTYSAPPPPAAPTISSVTPNSGTTAGGTSVTVTGTNFTSGASLSFGGVQASNVVVASSTSITATTPAHAAGAVNVVVTNPDNQSATLTNGFTYNSPSTLPSFGHVFLVVEENHSYASVIGSAAMPYLNTLASRYGLATNYYANTQPSIGNYFWLTTGQVVTNDSNFSGTVTVDNIVRQLNASGKTWKSYAESLPSVGYTGGNQYPYVKRHNPFAYLSDVLDSPAQANKLVPFSQFATDLANFQLPNYSFIVPNQLNNAHDCPAGNPSCTDADKLAAADNWLKTNIDPLIASPAFQQDGLLVIVFDESDDSDTANGGGHIATLVISSKAKQNFQSTAFYQHENTLRLMAEGLGLTSFPGAAAGASNMGEFFGATNTAPIISTITPNTGTSNGGTSVTIRGTGFVSGANVNFGGTPATNVTVVGSTTITATTPAHAAGAVSVTVSNPNNQSATLTNGFTYNAPPPPAPTLSGISPTSGPTLGGTSVSLTGTGFVSGATVSFGGASATSVSVVNGTSITATTPAHAAGVVNVVVTNPDNQSATLTNGYTYNAPPPPAAPTISSVTPNSGTTAGGTSVTVTGTNFTSGASLSFGGVQASNVVVASSTSITATTPAHAAGAVNVVVTNPDNQSATLTNGFTYTSAPPGETVLLVDDFNDNVLNATKWVSNNVFSGFTDTSVAVSEKNQRLEIGALKQNLSGSHYNGIRSATSYNFSGAYAYIEIVQTAASATAADTMLTLGKDGNNYYRIYVEAGNLICQKKLNGTKTDLLTLPYNAVNHRFLRIRHDLLSGNVIFETASGSAGVPGTWVQRTSQLWNTAALSLADITFELKAGTWQVETVAPGTAIFDNFKAAKP